MNSALIVLIYFLTSTITYSQSSILGTWQPEGQEAIFKIFEKDGKYYGQLIGSDNPEEDKQIKKQSEIVLLSDIVKESDSIYCCGSFISPKNKKKANASIILRDKNTIELTVKKAWYSKSITWHKI